MDVAVEIHCGACGSANFGLPDGTSDEAVILCNDCGMRLGTIAELKTEMLDQALAHSAEALRKALANLHAGKAI